MPNAAVRGRQRSGDRQSQGQGRQGELVFDLSRASPRRRAFPQGPRLPARRRGAYSQPGRRTGHEHGHRRRHQSGLEARGGAGGRAPDACSTATRPSGSASPAGWWPPPIAASARDRRGCRSPTSCALASPRCCCPRSASRRRAIHVPHRSQITLNYRGGPLSAGARATFMAATIAVGGEEEADNFASLAAIVAGSRLRTAWRALRVVR